MVIAQMQTSQGGSPIAAIFMLLVILIIAGLVLSIWGLIFKKAGYSFWLCLLMIVPIANLIWLLIFALSKWPIQQELERMQQHYGYAGSGFPVMPPPGQGYAPPPPMQR